MSIVVAEALYKARKYDKILFIADKFDACHPMSQILSMLTA